MTGHRADLRSTTKPPLASRSCVIARTTMPKAIAIRRVEGPPGKVYYPLEYVDLPEQPLEPRQTAIKIQAAALNHRDLFIRQHLYRGTTFGVPLLSDGCGTVIEAGSSVKAQSFKGKRVILNPGSGWNDDPAGPETASSYAILGGTTQHPVGTLCETVVLDSAELELAAAHMTDTEAAALPLTGLTAWRATVTKSKNAYPGRNILITGIGGGVALMALMFARAKGTNVYVSSSSEEKLKRARMLGATGTVNYSKADWESSLITQLPEERKYLDAIIDGAGGDIVSKACKMLKVSL